MPVKNRTRTRVAPGIYDDRCGRSGVVTVKGKKRECRFPPGTDLDVVKRWQTQARAELDRERPDPGAAPAPARGTFTADLPRFLLLIKGRVAYKSDRSHLKAWTPIIGPLLRSNVKDTHVKKGIATWKFAGKSARTIRHRIRVLRELYQTLDGAHAKPPTLGVKQPRPADPHPTAVSIKLIQRVAHSLLKGKRHKRGYGSSSTKTHARFLVRATTGQRPCQVMRAQPSDVDLRRGIWFVRAAKDGRSVPYPLGPDEVRAWRAFIKADAWGRFDARSFSKTIRRHGWPKGIRPYTLRHTFAIDHLRAGTDIGDLQGLLGHRQLETTRKFYAPILVSRLTKAIGRRKLRLAS
jgi:integrase